MLINEVLEAQPPARDLLVKQGTLGDATLIQARKRRPLTDKQKRRNRKCSRIQVAIERVIGTRKWRYGLERFP